MSYLLAASSNVVRSKGDPKVLATGPSSMEGSDRLARALGWFSIGLGVAELFAPRLLTRALGVEGRETLVRAYGLREVGAGVMTLSADKAIGLQSRVVGDALDAATLVAIGSNSPKRNNVAIAMAMVLGVAVLDLVGTVWIQSSRRRKAKLRSYRDRSGFPQGLEQARGAARGFRSASQRLPQHPYRQCVE